MDKNQQITLLNYENRLLKDQREINDTIYGLSRDPENMLMQRKIEFLQNEITYMSQQLDLLKKTIQQPVNSTQAAPKAPQPVTQQVQMTSMPKTMPAAAQETARAALQPATPPITQATPAPTTVTKPAATPAPAPKAPQASKPVSTPVTASVQTEKKTTNFEKLVGKAWMAIFASVLIFISIVIFATLVIPGLSDGAKMAIMYTFSLGLTGVSLFLLFKKPQNKLFLSLLGCGMGSVYISLFLTNAYFKAMGDITLYVAVLLWGIAICLLSRFNAYVFQIIGQLGITISIICGTALCTNTHDSNKFIFLAVFYVVSTLIFSLLHFKKEFKKNVIPTIFSILNGYILVTGALALNATAVYVIIMCFLVFNILFYALACTHSERSCLYGIYTIFVSILFWINDVCFIKNVLTVGKTDFICMFYLYAIILLLLAHFKFAKTNKLTIQISTLCMLPLVTLCYSHTDKALFFFALLCTIVMLLTKEELFRYAGLFYTFCFLVGSPDRSVLYIIFGLVILALHVVTLFAKYNVWIKNLIIALLYIYVLDVFLLVLPDFDIAFLHDNCGTITFVIMGILHVFICHSRASKDFKTKAPELVSTIFLGVINGILMLCGLIFLCLQTDLHPWVMLTTIIIFSNNSINCIKTNSTALHLYVSLKYTCLLLFIMTSYDASGLVNSTGLLIMAVAHIILGFKLKLKTFRIYGLILANLSIIKLVLFDWVHESNMELAVSFFICGVLCFLISFIYTRLEIKNK